MRYQALSLTLLAGFLSVGLGCAQPSSSPRAAQPSVGVRLAGDQEAACLEERITAGATLTQALEVCGRKGVEPVAGVATVRLEITEPIIDAFPRVETIWREMGAWEDPLLTQVLTYAMRLDAQTYIGLTRHDPTHPLRIPDDNMPLYVFCVSVNDARNKAAALLDAKARCTDFLARFQDTTASE